MLPLESKRWALLHHCNGNGRDIPKLLRRLKDASRDCEFHQVLDDLMNDLWHQCDYCSAAAAVVPHLGSLARSLVDQGLRSNLVASIALIEISRLQYIQNKLQFGKGDYDDVTPIDLAPDYHETISSIKQLVALADEKPLSDGDRRRYDGSVMVANGDWELGWNVIAQANNSIG